MNLNDLKVPTNPHYDWEVDPLEQAEYTNPVTLNNKEVQWANAAIAATQALVRFNRKVADLKNKLQDAKNALDDFEQDLLRVPPPPAATKSLKLLDSHLMRSAGEQGTDGEYKACIDKVRQIGRELVKTEIEVENCRQVLQMIKMLGEHAQTHLAYLKAEAQNAKKYT